MTSIALEIYNTALRACNNASKLRPRLSHEELMPFLKAEREAWQAHFGPKLKEHEQRNREERDTVTNLLQSAARGWTEDQRVLVTKITGIVT
jgi:FtsZ-binding cell division protein ZapB